MERSRCKKSRRAFSLVELLITTAIVSTGLVVILQALSFSSRLTALSCDIVKAAFVAENLLEEFEIMQARSALTQTSANSRTGKFSWEYATAEAVFDQKAYTLDLSVGWQRLNRQEKIQLNTYLRNRETP